jgi:hypothetical protein
LVTKGFVSAKAIMHANVLLSADETISNPKLSEKEIAEQYHVNPQTVHAIRKCYAIQGLSAAIIRKNA